MVTPYLAEELKVFLEGSDVFYGTFFSTVVLDGHSEVFMIPSPSSFSKVL